MRKNKIDTFISDYCHENGIQLLIDPDLEKDNGICYPSCREIHLSDRYTSGPIKLAVFLHECGHIKTDASKKNLPFNSFECEFRAWYEGLQIYKKAFKRAFSRRQAKFMLTCLKSYCESQAEFKRIKENLV